MHLSLFGGAENPCGLHDDVDAEGSPGQLLRITFRKAVDVPVADDGIVSVHPGVEMCASVIGVVFKQMEIGFGVEEIVDGHNLGLIPILAVNGAENLPADTTEAVDADSYFTHGKIL